MTQSTDKELIVEEARFGAIKRDEYFWFKGIRWKRVRGRFATPVNLIGTGHCGECFDIETIVLKDLNNEQINH